MMLPPTALVVDDHSDIRMFVKRTLTHKGFTVVEAADGQDAVRLARQCQPSVVLLDLCMPGLDGWEVASQMRSDPALEDVPIIVMTAYYLSTTWRLAHQAGCQHVIAKPFTMDDLTNAVSVVTAPEE